MNTQNPQEKIKELSDLLADAYKLLGSDTAIIRNNTKSRDRHKLLRLIEQKGLNA